MTAAKKDESKGAGATTETPDATKVSAPSEEQMAAHEASAKDSIDAKLAGLEFPTEEAREERRKELYAQAGLDEKGNAKPV